jgi:hypothetical protein
VRGPIFWIYEKYGPTAFGFDQNSRYMTNMDKSADYIADAYIALTESQFFLLYAKGILENILKAGNEHKEDGAGNTLEKLRALNLEMLLNFKK